MSPNITQLEEVLEQAIAAVFWRGEPPYGTFRSPQSLIHVAAAVRSVGDQSQGDSEKVQYSLQVSPAQPASQAPPGLTRRQTCRSDIGRYVRSV